VHEETDSTHATFNPKPQIEAVRQTVEQHFPGLWLAVDAALSVSATLLLAKNTNPTALIYVGGASSSKTTVVDMFADADVTVTDRPEPHSLFYLSDSIRQCKSPWTSMGTFDRD
jgi:hypothetical protein